MATDFEFEKRTSRPKPKQEKAAPAKQTPRSDPAGATHQPGAPSDLISLQKTVGNSAVQRLLAQRSGSGPAELDEETAAAINRERGSGSQLDGDVAAKAGATMGRDFSDVTVHADSQADRLSRQLGARAFTTGNDIFFRDGAYDPASSDGQRLIAHELTHVVQQGASPPTVQGQMTVNDPDDQYEAEADAVADHVMNAPDETALQRQAEPAEEEEEDLLQMQEEEEIEEEML